MSQSPLPNTKASQKLDETLKTATKILPGFSDVDKNLKTRIKAGDVNALIDEVFKERLEKVSADFKVGMHKVIDAKIELERAYRKGIQELNATLDKKREELTKEAQGLINMVENVKQERNDAQGAVPPAVEDTGADQDNGENQGPGTGAQE